MKRERRTDGHQAKVIEAAIRIETLWGCVSAWYYLHGRGVHRATAVRVLTKNGARRAGDPQHPAIRDALARESASGADQRVETMPEKPGDRIQRTNLATAHVVERAIELASTQGRHYGEGLLRIYGLDTATVMRVLFEPHRRRRKVITEP